MSVARYFAYGSNMCSSRLAARVGAPRVVGAAVLHHYEHRFNKLGRDGSAKGNIVPAKGRRVLGVVYELGRDQLIALAEFEGGYGRVRVEPEVVVDGRRLEAAAFRGILVSDRVDPRRQYLDHYARGIAEHGLSEDYLREIAPAWYFGEK